MLSLKSIQPQTRQLDFTVPCHEVLSPRLRPGGSPGANLKSISHRCHLREKAFEWELTEETIHLPLGCLQGGPEQKQVMSQAGWVSGSGFRAASERRGNHLKGFEGFNLEAEARKWP